MAINNFARGNGIRTETNVQGTFVDNDEYVASRAHDEHNHVNTTSPWGQGYQPPQPEPIWQEEPAPPLVLDDELKAAIKRDLRIRNIHTPN
jgi:hypothetical protein